MYTINHVFDLGDLGRVYGYVDGTVHVTEHGHTIAHITRAIVLINIGTDVTALLSKSVRADLEEALAEAHQAAIGFGRAGA